MAENQEGCTGPQLPPPPPVPPPPTPPLDGASVPKFGAPPLDGASGPLFGAQPSSVPIVMTPPEEELDGSNKVKHESFDLNNVEVIDDLNINRWLMRIMRLGASYVSTGSNGYRSTGSVSSSSSGSKSRRLSIADTSASNLLRPPNTSRGRRFSDSMNFDADVPWVKLQKPVPRKGGFTLT